MCLESDKTRIPQFASITCFHLETNKTTINILDIRAQVDAGQEKWPKGINLQSDKTTIKDIDKFVKFKILKYKAYDFKDNELWEVYKEDFNNFMI